MVQLSVAQILSASSNIIANPNKSVSEELGVSAVDVVILILNPNVFIAKKVYDWIKNKLKANEEKERVYREIIAKQQAAIKKQQEVNRELEKCLRESYATNSQNQEEIRVLRQQLKNLEELIEFLEKTRNEVA